MKNRGLILHRCGSFRLEFSITQPLNFTLHSLLLLIFDSLPPCAADCGKFGRIAGVTAPLARPRIWYSQLQLSYCRNQHSLTEQYR